MAAPTIPNGEEHFFPIIYEGNGAGQRVGKFVPFTNNGTIANSCIFNRADSATMSRTLETPTNGKIWTFSTWFKRGNLDSDICKFLGYSANNGGGYIGIVSNEFYISDLTYSGGWTVTFSFDSTRTLEDTSKWYHLMVAVDTTDSTANDRVKLYIDGDRVTSLGTSTNPAQDLISNYNGGSGTLYIGRRGYDTTNLLDGYMAETNFVDGTALTPSTFGVTDTSTGRWIPKTLSGITYGNSGWRLTYADSSALGDDTSGNTNDFTVSNIVAGDQTTDSPTQNFATFDPFDSGNNAGSTPGTAVLAEGNTRVTAPSNPSNWDQYRTSKPLLSGKYYVEVTLTSLNTATYFGVISKNQSIKNNGWYSDQKTGWSYDSSNGKTENSNNGYISYGGARSQGDVVGIAVDLDNGTLWFSENGTYPNSGNPATGANPAYSNLKLAVQDGGLCFTEARGYSGHNDWNFGQKSYTHSAPSGFSTVQQDNMPETVKGVSGLSWIKDRDSASYSHFLFDSSRGKGNALKSNSSNAQSSYNPNELQKFLKGGYSVGSSTEVNRATSYASWNWVANSGTTASNGTGSVTSTVQANTTAGFSIIEATAPASGNFTIGHGLSSAPDFFWLKMTGTTGNWVTFHHSIATTSGEYMLLDTTGAMGTAPNAWGAALPTSSVIGLGAGSSVTGSQPFIIHAWHEVSGFSKFGKYEGNNNADGTFVYTGFKPAFVIIKSIDGGSSSYPWAMYDSKRSPNNPVSLFMSANATDVENTLDRIDFLSNGFKCRQAYSYSNAGETYIYMAWAEHPFVGDGTNPVTAR